MSGRRPKIAKIEAGRWHNPTPYHLIEGKQYRFVASGEWTDSTIKADATGFDDPRFKRWEKFRRAPEARWFSLIGRIGKKKSTQFDIGKLIMEGQLYRASTTGRLYCFANDLLVMYWNNNGAIDLQVEEVNGYEVETAG